MFVFVVLGVFGGVGDEDGVVLVYWWGLGDVFVECGYFFIYLVFIIKGLG